MEEQKIEKVEQVKKETKKTTVKATSSKTSNDAKKPAAKKLTSKTENAKKSTSNKTAKKPVSKTSKKKTLAKAPVKTTKVATPTAKVTKAASKKVEKQENVDQILDVAVQAENPKVELAKSVTNVQKVKKMPDVKRPQPKPRNFTKDEKVALKKLEEAFTYVANMTTVIEEKTMDFKQIPDLTISELHVVEMVNKNNNKPMTIIANKLNVTVGSLITCVNRLIQKDYLVRTRDEMDHRVILLSVTPKAKKVLKVHDKFHNDILLLALEGTPLSYAVKVMTQFAATLENYMNPKEEKEKKAKK